MCFDGTPLSDNAFPPKSIQCAKRAQMKDFSAKEESKQDSKCREMQMKSFYLLAPDTPSPQLFHSSFTTPDFKWVLRTAEQNCHCFPREFTFPLPRITISYILLDPPVSSVTLPITLNWHLSLTILPSIHHPTVLKPTPPPSFLFHEMNCQSQASSHFQSSSHGCGLFKDPALAAIPSPSCLTHFPLSAWPGSPMYKHPLEKPFLDPTTTHFSLPFCSKISPKCHLYLISPLSFYCPFFPQSAGEFWIGACNKGIKHTKWYLVKRKAVPFPFSQQPSFPP